ncbi:MAG: hypothetical protein LBV58_02330, partial [Acholeplasmatales bacterium]|nr:hypothetical protein [Acholeplasmatales bacterium]
NPNLSSDEVGRLNIILDNLAKKDIVTKQELVELNERLANVRTNLIASNKASGHEVNSVTSNKSLDLIEELEFSDSDPDALPGYFMVIKESDGYHFVLKNSSDELLITSSYGYKEASGVTNGVNNFKKMLANASFQILVVVSDSKKFYKLSIKNKNSMVSKFTYESNLYESVEEIKEKSKNLLQVISKAVIRPYNEA